MMKDDDPEDDDDAETRLLSGEAESDI